MTKKELAQYKEILLSKKAEIENSIKKKDLRTPNTESSRHGDLADRSSAAIETEISLQLKQTDAKLLRAIDKALERIEDGTFGICVECADEPLGLCKTCPEIPHARLKVVPWTKVCVAVKEQKASS